MVNDAESRRVQVMGGMAMGELGCHFTLGYRVHLLEDRYVSRDLKEAREQSDPSRTSGQRASEVEE